MYGVVSIQLSPDRQRAGYAVVRTETDFAARTDRLREAVASLAKLVLARGVSSPAVALALPGVQRGLADAARALREQVVLGDAGTMSVARGGVLGAYVHHDRSLGAVVGLWAPTGDLGEVARDVSMHLTAHDPVADGAEALLAQRFVKVPRQTVGALLRQADRDARFLGGVRLSLKGRVDLS